MVTAAGVRIGWRDVPADVRAAVETHLGAPVVEAVSQPGGFSPGSADRVRTSAGRRAFVKAVGAALDAHAVELHRREAAVTARLPPEVPAPRLLAAHDTGEWVALVLDDVDGHPPSTPPGAEQVAAVEAALRRLVASPAPAALRDLPAVGEDLRFALHGWDRVRVAPPPSLPDDVARHLDALATTAAAAPTALAGDRLVHADVRADNLLLRPGGGVVLVDWPHAGRGAPWFDLLSFAVNLATSGDPDAADGLLDRLPGAPTPGQVDAVLAGMAGYFVDAARRRPPPGLPTLRAFQAAQGDAVLDLLRRRGVVAPA